MSTQNYKAYVPPQPFFFSTTSSSSRSSTPASPPLPTADVFDQVFTTYIPYASAAPGVDSQCVGEDDAHMRHTLYQMGLSNPETKQASYVHPMDLHFVNPYAPIGHDGQEASYMCISPPELHLPVQSQHSSAPMAHHHPHQQAFMPHHQFHPAPAQGAIYYHQEMPMRSFHAHQDSHLNAPRFIGSAELPKRRNAVSQAESSTSHQDRLVSPSPSLASVEPPKRRGERALARLQRSAVDPERHWACGMCIQKFARKSDLTRHVKRHAGRKDYPCTAPSCPLPVKDRGFFRADARRRHWNKSPSCEIEFYRTPEGVAWTKKNGNRRGVVTPYLGDDDDEFDMEGDSEDDADSVYAG